MKCPECGGAELVDEVRDVPYTYRGETTVIRGVRGDWCPRCGEGVMPMGDDSLGQAMLAFNREVNARFVDPSYIAQVRRKLRLDQREAAEIFGGGVNAFSRYENGRMLPPVALVKLLKLLDRHPELLEEVRAA